MITKYCHLSEQELLNLISFQFSALCFSFFVPQLVSSFLFTYEKKIMMYCPLVLPSLFYHPTVTLLLSNIVLTEMGAFQQKKKDKTESWYTSTFYH